MAATRDHRYAVSLNWSGNLGSGTSAYRDYSRNYEISAEGKPVINGSADPAFRGDRSRWNPEELLVASLSACHKLWYLHLAAEAGIIVTAYTDRAEGVMEVDRDGAGRFRSVVLRPTVTVATGSDVRQARALHKPAHERCFIANSVNFAVECEPEIVAAGQIAEAKPCSTRESSRPAVPLSQGKKPLTGEGAAPGWGKLSTPLPVPLGSTRLIAKPVRAIHLCSLLLCDEFGIARTELT